jgi:hypothetical protein
LTPTVNDGASPIERLEQLAGEAVSVAKRGRKHKQNLSGGAFYARKLAELRILATNAFVDLKSGTAGNTSALAELIASVFSPNTEPRRRSEAERELIFALRTTWRGNVHPRVAFVEDGIFPLTLLEQTGRGYLIIIGRQINDCFMNGFYDACAVMMRRLLEISIIDAFEAKGVANKIRDTNGNYFQLTDLVTAALSELSFTLSRNTKRALPRLRDNGHLSAHGRSYFAQRADLERVQPDFRVATEELLRVSGLL